MVNEKRKAMSYDYILNGNWTSALCIWQQAGQWAEAYRVAKASGGILNHEQTAYLWARSLGIEAAISSLGQELLVEAINFSVTRSDFEFAFGLCHRGVVHRLQFVQQKYAENLAEKRRLAEEFKQRGEFQAAEEQYMLVDDWTAAVNMYQQMGRWSDAYRLAQTFGDESARKQISYLWAKSLDVEAIKLLTQQVIDEAINVSLNNGDFNFFLDLCHMSGVVDHQIHHSLEEENVQQHDVVAIDREREALSVGLDLRLIEAMKNRPELYNDWLRSYKPGATDALWSSVAEEVGEPVDVIKKPWVRLKRKFRDEKKKPESDWAFFDRLKFLDENSGAGCSTSK
ncbi:hypothetical protein ACQ4LE_010825 [Meloidogyne hapla]